MIKLETKTFKEWIKANIEIGRLSDLVRGENAQNLDDDTVREILDQQWRIPAKIQQSQRKINLIEMGYIISKYHNLWCDRMEKKIENYRAFCATQERIRNRQRRQHKRRFSL